MGSISWDETLPSDSENAGLGDDRIRSLKSSLRVGLAEEHIWPSGGGDAGVHLLGAGRPFYGQQSLVSSAGTDGRLMQTSDTSNFFHVGSGGTSFIGGQRVVTGPAVPGGQRYYWAEEFGTATKGPAQITVIFPSGFSGIPYVFVNGLGSSSAILPIIRRIDPQSFDLGDGFSSSTYTLIWRSFGTRIL